MSIKIIKETISVASLENYRVLLYVMNLISTAVRDMLIINLC